MNSKFQLEPFHRDMPDELLLNDLRAVAQQQPTGTVTAAAYNRHGSYHSATLARRFGSWFRALDEAGLGRTRNLHVSDEELFRNIYSVWMSLGRQPRYKEIAKPLSAYSAGTYDYRFGSWRAALEAFVSWANEDELSALPKGSNHAGGGLTPRNPNWRLRALVLMRDGARCRLCGATPDQHVRLHVDHIVPWSKGGRTKLENLQILCERCNIGKSNVELATET